jgi:hypothetical protein
MLSARAPMRDLGDDPRSAASQTVCGFAVDDVLELCLCM